MQQLSGKSQSWHQSFVALVTLVQSENGTVTFRGTFCSQFVGPEGPNAEASPSRESRIVGSFISSSL